MSHLVIDWAETAPVADVYERAIITQMAHRANKDGTGAYPSIPTMARYALCDEKTIERRLEALRKRKLIALGNQSLARHIPARYRPRVYDLLVPYAWYSAAQLDKVNQERAERGRPPLTPKDRPPLAEPAKLGRKPRADKGVKRTPKTEKTSSDGVSDVEAGLIVPPVDNPTETSPGGTNSPDEGGLTVRRGGTNRPPKQSLGKRSTEQHSSGGPPPRTPPAPAADAAGTEQQGQPDLSEETDKGSCVRNPQHARARKLAGPAACEAIDTDPDIALVELERIVSGADPRLTQGQVVYRAAALQAWERKAARSPDAEHTGRRSRTGLIRGRADRSGDPVPAG
jgi:hypothetical protein